MKLDKDLQKAFKLLLEIQKEFELLKKQLRYTWNKTNSSKN